MWSSRPTWTTKSETTVLAAVGVVAGIACASGLIGMVGLSVCAAVGGIAYFVITRPRRALYLGFALLVLAHVKFRNRDAGAALSGELDAQVLFELCLYGIIFFIAAANFLLLPQKRVSAKPTSNEICLFSFVFLAALSVFWSYAPAVTAVRSFQWMILYCFMFEAVRHLKPPQFMVSFGISLLSGVLFCSLVSALFPSLRAIELSHRMMAGLLNPSRFSWFAVHPLDAASEVGAAIVFVLSTIFWSKRHNSPRLLRLPLSVYLLPLVVILVATRARGAIAATLAATIVMALKRYRTLRVVSWFGLAIGAVILLVFVNGGLDTNLLESGNGVSEYLLRGGSSAQFLSLNGRTELWRGVIRLVMKRPLLGYGFVSARKVLPNMVSWDAGEAHDTYLELLLGLGIIGETLALIPLTRTVLGTIQPDHHAAEWVNGLVLGTMIFLMINGIANTGFTAPVSYDPVTFFTCLFAYRRRDPVRSVARFSRGATYEPLSVLRGAQN